MTCARIIGVLVALLLPAGCSLKQDDGCATEPAGVGGSGTAVCTKPPPAQFSQLGQ